MKFDCLLTNPPYQDSSHVEKKNTLWRKWISFNEKIVKDNGITSLVIPSSWMGSGPILRENFLENPIFSARPERGSPWAFRGCTRGCGVNLCSNVEQ